MKTPNAGAPIVSTLTGILTPVWAQFFASLGNPAPAIVPVTLGASPFAYTAAADGFLAISGGSVSGLSLKRGPTTISLPGSLGIVPLSNGDVLTLTYSGAPNVNFVPS